MLCRKNSFIFQSNAPCTCTLCTFWGLDITPKTPSGGHTSLGMTQQSQRVSLRETRREIKKGFSYQKFLLSEAFYIGILLKGNKN